MPKRSCTATPSGPATSETGTIMHASRVSSRVRAECKKSGCGFVANALAGPATLWDLQNRNGRGQPGRVERHDDQNLFVPD
jgi:hypothetical protein